MLLKVIRFWVPTLLCLAGVGIIIAGAVGGGELEPSLTIGIPVFSAGASIWLLNFLYRVGVSGDKERDSEEDARTYFAKHGHWPGEGTGAEGGGR